MQKDLVERVEAEHAKHHTHCPGEAAICLGPAESFDMSQSGEVDILVHEGQVFLFIHCPSTLHEVAVTKFSKAIDQAVTKLLNECGANDADMLFYNGGSADHRLQNALGCHSWQKKQPDAQFNYVSQVCKLRMFPFMILEVAVNHEDLFKLLIEGAMWLDKATDVVYVILVKIWKKDKKIEIFVAERMPEGELAEGGPKISCKSISDDEISAMGDHEIEQMFGLAILFHEIIEMDSQECRNIVLNGSKILEGTSFLETVESPQLIIKLEKVIRFVFMMM